MEEAKEAHLQEAGDELAEGVRVGLHQPLLHLRVLDVRPEGRNKTHAVSSVSRSRGTSVGS